MAEQNLATWLETLDAELGDYTIDEESMHIVLDLARDAAHTITRPASPLTVFAVGYLVGRGASLGQAAARLTELILASDEPEVPGEVDPEADA